MATNNPFNLTHLILLESNFKREWTLNLEHPEFGSSIDLQVEDTTEENILSVYLKLTYSAGVGDSKEITAYVNMVGVFDIENIGDIPTEQFAKINAPAIIFPFVREHLSSLSTKSGINPILLQPVNFVKRNEAKKDTTGSK
jgi:preprotein translocase subunit SecB